MIESVSIAGAPVALADVFASVTIRHGRRAADDGPLSSSCSLSIVGVDRAYAAAFRVGAALAIDVSGAVPRFRGWITDAALEAGELAIVAAGPLGHYAGREVGAIDWPAEAWSVRVARVFAEAGIPTLLELEAGDTDPELAAREASPAEFQAILAELAETNGAAIADTPAGTILVQPLTARKSRAIVALDSSAVAYAPTWTQTDEIANVVTVKWNGGEETRTDASSAAEFEEQPDTIDTSLASSADAISRALLELTRRARPEWLVGEAELLELELELELGTPALLSDLPDDAPKAQTIGMLEGWEDRHVVNRDGELEWRMALTLSAARLSGYGARWESLNPALTWATVNPALTWADNEELLYA